LIWLGLYLPYLLVFALPFVLMIGHYAGIKGSVLACIPISISLLASLIGGAYCLILLALADVDAPLAAVFQTPALASAIALGVAIRPRAGLLPLPFLAALYLFVFGVFSMWEAGLIYLACSFLVALGAFITTVVSLSRSRRGEDYWRQFRREFLDRQHR
jgi:hypothetical protein